MARIGIYGGTFGPVHVGHVEGAKYALKALELDRLLIIPAYTAPHKSSVADMPTPQQRLEMLSLAFAGEESITVSDLELRRGGISYTYQTLQDLRQQYPEDAFFLIMGDDMFLSVDTWKEPNIIFQEATLAVLCRGGDWTAVKAKEEDMSARGVRVALLKNPVRNISSTQLRRLLAFRCADSFLPEGVAAYIRENGLYSRNYKDLSMEQLEEAVTDLLNPNRVRHTLGCRDTARELAKIWGADETDAARAGLLHDVTKALDGPLQLTLCSRYGVTLDVFSTQNPKTLHALTGSLVAARIFGENKAVVDAIRSHTTGKAGMNTLEKIIYVADYMEPCRDFPGVEELRHLAYTDLDGALKMGLEMTLEMLKSQGREISPESSQALEYLKMNL